MRESRQERRRKEREALKKLEEQEVVGKGVHVAICIPTHDSLPAYFAYDLANLCGWTQAHFNVPGAIEQITLHMVKGTYVHSARHDLAASALRAGADYLLFLDSDMRFPKDALVRLLGHKKAMVGTNYPKRSVPPEYVAIKRMTYLDPDGVRQPGELLQTRPESEGLESVDALGFGCVLVHSSVFEAMAAIHDPREKGPFWFFDYEAGGLKVHMGEDVYFCRLAREAGVDIYVDHDLSKDLRHIGQFEYGFEHTWAFYEEEKQRGEDHQLHDAPDGDRGRAEQVGPDGDDSGVRAESGEPAGAGRAS